MPSAERATEHSPERAEPEAMAGRLMESEHRGRYLWASQLVSGATVLDAGCGTGYGTQTLAMSGARRVVGVDISEEAIAYSRREFSDEDCEFVLGDLEQLPFEEDSFDVVVCFEVIEHVEHRSAVIAELRRVLRPSGILVLSSPNRGVYPEGNPYHIHEYTPEELLAALKGHFGNVRLHRQSSWLASAVLEDSESAARGADARFPISTVKIAAVSPGQELYTVALAGDDPVPEPSSLLVMGLPFEIRWWEDQVAAANAAREQQAAATLKLEAEHERDQRSWGTAMLAVESDLAAANGRIEQLNAQQAAVSRWAEDRKAEVAAVAEDLRASRQESRDFENRLARAEQTMAEITASASWRLTGPLRLLKRLFADS